MRGYQGVVLIVVDHGGGMVDMRPTNPIIRCGIRVFMAFNILTTC